MTVIGVSVNGATFCWASRGTKFAWLRARGAAQALLFGGLFNSSCSITFFLSCVLYTSNLVITETSELARSSDLSGRWARAGGRPKNQKFACRTSFAAFNLRSISIEYEPLIILSDHTLFLIPCEVSKILHHPTMRIPIPALLLRI